MLTKVRLVCDQASRWVVADCIVDAISLFLVDCYCLSLSHVVHLNSLVVLQHLLGQQFGKRHEDIEVWRAMNEAAKRNRLGVMRKLVNYRPDLDRTVGMTPKGCDPFTIAATYGHVAMLQWLTKNQPRLCCDTAMLSAARNGQLEVVRFFGRKGVEKSIAIKATKVAATFGHCEVAEYLWRLHGEQETPLQNLEVMKALSALEDEAKGAVDAGGDDLSPGMQLLRMESEPHVLDESVMLMVVRKPHGLQMLQRFQHRFPRLRVSVKALAVACVAGNVPLVRWIYANFTDAHQKASVTTAQDHAYKLQHLDVIKFFLDLGLFPTKEQLDQIVGGLLVKVLNYLLHEYRCDGSHQDVQEEYLKMATRLRNLLANESLMYAAVATDNLAMLQMVLPYFSLKAFVPILLRQAIAQGSRSCVAYLYAQCYAGCMPQDKCGSISMWMDAIRKASARGFFDGVCFMLLRERLDHADFSEIINCACTHRQVRVIKWLHQCDVEGFTEAAMDHAAASGALSIVRFLHEHRSEGCSIHAMNRAALGGFLHVVQFLHWHRHEGCTAVAMKNAASRGHVRVVEFLHSHRQEGISRNGISEAALHGHLEVVQFLLAHRTDVSAQDALENACKRDQLEIVQWLLHQEYHCNYRQALEAMREEDKSSMLATLRASLARRQAIEQLLEEEVQSGHIAKKLRVV